MWSACPLPFPSLGVCPSGMCHPHVSTDCPVIGWHRHPPLPIQPGAPHKRKSRPITCMEESSGGRCGAAAGGGGTRECARACSRAVDSSLEATKGPWGKVHPVSGTERPHVRESGPDRTTQRCYLGRLWAGLPLLSAVGELAPSEKTITGCRLVPGVFPYPWVDDLRESFKIFRLTDQGGRRETCGLVCSSLFCPIRQQWEKEQAQKEQRCLREKGKRLEKPDLQPTPQYPVKFLKVKLIVQCFISYMGLSVNVYATPSLKDFCYAPGGMGSFDSGNPLSGATKRWIAGLNRSQVVTWPANQDACKLQKAARKSFERNKDYNWIKDWIILLSKYWHFCCIQNHWNYLFKYYDSFVSFFFHAIKIIKS